MPVKDVPFAFGCGLAQRRVIRLVDMLEVGLKAQPMLPQHIPIEVLTERSLDHSRLNLLDPEGFTHRYLSGLHIGVQDELLLGFTVGLPEAVKALVGHTDELGMLLLRFLIVSQFLGLGLGLLIFPGGQRSGINRPVTLGPRSYLKDFGAA
ncbi:hypothetical protein [Mesorhizobium sp. B1-1-6]|uniref:hypothetical protein n=1 Tax=Mesorhizobium sp. B1-1-6 TaxID=2589978 RepID=UPI00112909A6|nr:hypothetical protein [Mesorhizobium sp. B1-1-6]TPN32523.1 hypothetical protein FJ979_26760 [Mesorhizobium sp. B1-1-6]